MVVDYAEKYAADIIRCCEERLNTSFADGCEISIRDLDCKSEPVFGVTVTFTMEPAEENVVEFVVYLASNNAIISGKDDDPSHHATRFAAEPEHDDSRDAEVDAYLRTHIYNADEVKGLRRS